MTATKIGLEDIASISTAEEGRAVALALFNQLVAAQCWVIVDEDGNTVDGPFFTQEQAKEDLSIMNYDPGCFDKFMNYKVDPWKGGAE